MHHGEHPWHPTLPAYCVAPVQPLPHPPDLTPCSHLCDVLSCGRRPEPQHLGKAVAEGGDHQDVGAQLVALQASLEGGAQAQAGGREQGPLWGGQGGVLGRSVVPFLACCL
jgi:hypothetical protein